MLFKFSWNRRRVSSFIGLTFFFNWSYRINFSEFLKQLNKLTKTLCTYLIALSKSQYLLYFFDLVKMFYSDESIADVWACEARNETCVSKSLLYEDTKNSSTHIIIEKFVKYKIIKCSFALCIREIDSLFTFHFHFCIVLKVLFLLL